jgi:hypothetical protein
VEDEKLTVKDSGILDQGGNIEIEIYIKVSIEV